MTIAQIKRDVWIEAARIASENTYMSETTLDGGDFGGPTCCEYRCGHVLAAEFERRAKQEECDDKAL